MGIYMGIMIILGPRIGYIGARSFYEFLLSVPIILSLVCFFLPVWNIHKIMKLKKIEHQRNIDYLNESKSNLESRMMNANIFDTEEYEQLGNKLDAIRQTIERNQQFTTWPFNTTIFRKLALTQIVPILGLFPGLAKPIVDAIKLLLESLGLYWGI
jgi:hypothetical protein